MKKIGLFLLFALLSFRISAQVKVGDNPTIVNPDAVLEIESTNKGLLMPRVALTATTDAAPMTAHVAGMKVYNTATAGDVIPGLYYNDGVKWVLLASAEDLKTEPWFDQVSNDEATENTQNIYQMGSVSILKDQVRVAALALDVFGPVSFGGTHTGAAGINSVILGGNNNMASGTNAVAGGENARAMGNFSFAFGPGSDALGHNTTNFGQNSSATALSANSFIAGGTGNTTSAINTFATGLTSTASGQHSFAAGSLSIASSQSEAVIGRANAITTGDASAIVATDAIFQVGIGGTAATRRNAMTVLKNGNIGVGIIGTEAAAKPTERLDVGSLGVRIRDINTAPYAGNSATDNVVVADGNGVLKTVAVGDVGNTSTVTQVIATGNVIATHDDGTGGTPTNILETITTLGIAAGELTYANEGGTNANVPLISTDANNGIIAGTDGALFADVSALEPWFSAATNTGATLNDENIYHFGYVGIGTEAPDRGLLIENNNVNDNKDDIMIRTYSGVSNNTPSINLRRAAGTTDAPGNLVDGDNIGALSFTPYFNGAFGSWHQTGFRANYKGDGTNGDTELEFRTSDASQMYITKDGNINFVQYPNTRDDSQFVAAVENLLYTDVFGNMLSASAASVVAEPWFDQANIGNPATANTQDIYQMGKVGIGTDDMLGTANPNVVLAINGAMLTTSSIYADYVFEDYFEGISELNKNYSFRSLSDIENFINENRHLPGITKVDALAKNAAGDYVINTTELSVQLLEKVEELYLHIIEQQKLLEIKDKKIQEFEARLKKLEDLLYR
ncbi:hypothetical protein ACFSKL_22260 [Belliella marina]|uniref:Peptidase S74 domain-containing protein n=1 Tax=Belliella marina TaxID=1644146 RepID=A0ABW4VS96_9BACT